MYSKYEHLIGNLAAGIERLECFTGIDFTGVDPHDALAKSG